MGELQEAVLATGNRHHGVAGVGREIAQIVVADGDGPVGAQGISGDGPYQGQLARGFIAEIDGCFIVCTLGLMAMCATCCRRPVRLIPKTISG